MKENIREGFLDFLKVMSYFRCPQFKKCVYACGNAVVVQYFVHTFIISYLKLNAKVNFLYFFLACLHSENFILPSQHYYKRFAYAKNKEERRNIGCCGHFITVLFCRIMRWESLAQTSSQETISFCATKKFPLSLPQVSDALNLTKQVLKIV